MSKEKIEILKKLIERDKNGSEFILMSNLYKVFSENDIDIVLNYIRYFLNIAIINDVITEKDRSPLVRDMEYGKVETYDIQDKDIPKVAQIEYANNNLVFDDYEALDEFLENEFIPVNVRLMKKRKSEDPNGNLYPFIQLNKIVKLKLSELELKHVMEYLKNQGIYVRGIDSTIDQDFENYDYYRTYKNQPLPKNISSDETLIKLDIYNKTKSKEVKKEIIVDNLRLVPWVAYKYSLMYNIDSKELESYGYEGLIRCVDKFNINCGYKFSTFAVSYIRGFIKRGISEIYSKQGKRDRWLIDFIRCKKIVEEIQCKKLEDNISLAPEIANLMLADGSISEQNYKLTLRRIYLICSDSFENINENYVFYESEDECSVIDDKVFLEQLRNSFNETIVMLNQQEQNVIILKYGLDGEEQRSLSEIAKIFCLSSERIRKIELKALNKLRYKPCCREKLIKYI